MKRGYPIPPRSLKDRMAEMNSYEGQSSNVNEDFGHMAEDKILKMFTGQHIDIGKTFTEEQYQQLLETRDVMVLDLAKFEALLYPKGQPQQDIKKGFVVKKNEEGLYYVDRIYR